VIYPKDYQIYRFLRNYFSSIERPVVIEIGAHLGTDTVKLSGLLNTPYVYLAIEPDPRNLKVLIPLCSTLNITVVPRAVGSCDGEQPFYFSAGVIPNSRREMTDCNSLKPPKDNVKLRPWMTFEKSVVNCVRLDTLCKKFKIDHIDLLWMDVQGAEMEVIEGGRQILKETALIYTECQENRYEGQPGLNTIKAGLPDFRVWQQFGDNVVLARL
jgi:FkbM family methyltransferase